ncbi:hypothetical protein [Lichenibacterium ramalinae]|uniref:Uncharacterized protein n=1 Tax=Lichenibacterium ramalinae TaxID=2316527 RepID=A0A4Q2R8P1_9HYPH|nr:hypothetical protein [Lichenibacterium ramalinae]RYB02109.1 hypothetical protein D3272_22570 [Lichenibacterium ramalinae]
MTIALPDPSLLRGYLERQGWMLEPIDDEDYSLYVREVGAYGEFELLVPRDLATSGAEGFVDQALRTLSDINERPIATIAEEVRGLGYDLFDAALPDSSEFRGSIPLKVADSLLHQTRTLMYSAAYAEFEAVASSKPGPSAHDYAEACRFAHTFEGSFGFRVMSYVGPQPERRLEQPNSPAPPARRIVQRIAVGLQAIREAVEVAEPSPIVRAASRGLNAESCFVLARLLDRSEADRVTFDFTFSPAWTLPEDMVGRKPVMLKTGAVKLIREAGNQLRAKPPETVATVSGRVVELASPYAPDDLLHPGGREIGVRWASDDFGDVTVRLRLTPVAYAEALEAHRRGRDVTVTGVVEPSRGGYRVASVVSFRTL